MLTRPAPATTVPSLPKTEDQTVTLSYLLGIARRRLPLVLVCWVSVVAAVSFWTLAQHRIYRAESMLRLDPEPPRPLGQKVELVANSNNGYWARKEFFETEFRVIRSYRIALRVVDSLALNADPAFLRVPAKQLPSFRPVAAEEAARVLIDRISVEPVKESSLVFVRYEDTDPKRARTILNAIVRAYLAQNLDAAASVSTTASEWLNGQLDHLKSDLEKSEIAVNDFRQKNNVLSMSLEDRHNIISSQLEQLSKDIVNLETKRAELASRSNELAKIDSKDPQQAGAAELLSSSVLSTLRGRYAEQKEKLAELLSAAGENNPRVAGARDKLKETEFAIQKEIDNIKAAARGDLRRVDQQLGDLKKRNEEVQKVAHELQSFEIAYNQLNRTKTNNEKLYGLVLERAREIDLTRVMNFNNMRVVDEALEPRAPVRPNVPMNVALAIAAGLVLGLGVALGRELTDRSLKTPADVERVLGLTFLGVLPAIEAERRDRSRSASPNDKPDLIIATDPECGFAEAARAIRTNLTFLSPDRPYRKLLVTSALPEEGKTTVACSLAITLAQNGHRTLLVDTDLRRPRIHRSFGFSNDLGVSLVVTGQATLDEAIHKTTIPNLDVLTSGPVPPSPAELVQSERFRQLIDQLGDRYDRIVFDSPPVLPVTDAAILSKMFDGVVLVAKAHQTPQTAARQAARQLLEINSPLVGIILNAVDLARADYRDYHYTYYRRYKHYALPPEKKRGKPSSSGARSGAEEE